MGLWIGVSGMVVGRKLFPIVDFWLADRKHCFKEGPANVFWVRAHHKL